MNFPDKYDDDFIDAYLLGNLDEESLQNFEHDLAKNNTLFEYLEARKKLVSVAISIGKSTLLENLKNIEKTLNEEGFFITDDEIAAFLANKSTPEIAEKITTLYTTDTVFKKRVEEQRHLAEAIEGIALKENILKVEQDLQTEGFFLKASPNKEKKNIKIINIQILRWTVAAATILILVMVGRFAFFSNNNTTDYYSLFSAPTDKLSPKIKMELSETGFGGAPATSLQELKKAMDVYQTKNYKEAIPLLKTYIKENPMVYNISEVQFYLAASYMGNKKAKEALPVLLALSASSLQGELASDTQWYLALCYLQNKQKEEGKVLLNKLQNDEKYKIQAKKLLEKLD